MSNTPVLDLLSDIGNWTQEDFARDKEGEFVSPGSDTAVCWCLLGAVRKCYPDAQEQDRAVTRLRSALPPEAVSIPDFNDTVTHEQILELLQKAKV